jgi:quercetin dioxygenase-like cupin family protein
MKNSSSQTLASAKFWRRWMVIPIALGTLGLLAAILGAIAITGPSGAVHAEHTETFTHRAPLDPYRINQPPDFMIHSRAATDIVMQKSEFPPGDGPWHTHPGPSFVFVEEGQIKLERFTKKDGCTETEVFRPGQAYFEVGNEVHRAVVVSEEPAVLHVTRFNIPVGGATTIPADDPGC